MPVLATPRRWLARGWRAAAGTTFGDAVAVAFQTRVTGLAAEASFWGIFAIPWAFLGLVAGLSKLQGWFGVDALGAFREQTLALADRVLTPQAIQDLLVPLLDSLVQGEGAISIFGFVVAVYAGSRLIGTLVDGMTIVYRQEGIRSFVQTRVISLGVYAAGLAGLILVIPLVILGPRAIRVLFPGLQSDLVSALLVAGQWLLVVAALISLYHVAAPHRTAWIYDAPGALLAIALFGLFSFLLRWYFTWLFRDGSVYGAISAPIAVMWWMYVTNLAVLLGAACNGALAVRRGWLAPLDPDPGLATGSAAGDQVGASAGPAADSSQPNAEPQR